MKLKIALAVLLINVVFIPLSRASFPMGKGKYLISPYISYYISKSYRDQTGLKKSYDNNGSYSSYTAQLYFEYGLTNRLDLIMKLPVSAIRIKDNLNTQHRTGAGDLEIGLRYNFLNFSDKKYFLSGQMLLNVPMYRKNVEPALGLGLLGSEFRVSFSGNLSAHYFNVESGYRTYFSSKSIIQQVLVNSNLGIHITKKYDLLGELSGRVSLKDMLLTPINPNSNTQYTYVKASAGVGRRLSDHNFISLNIFHDVFNRNSGIGAGCDLRLISRF